MRRGILKIKKEIAENSSIQTEKIEKIKDTKERSSCVIIYLKSMPIQF